MKSFIYRGKELEFHATTGEVIKTDKHTESRISSSGGGGYVSEKYGGYIAPAVIKSSTVVNHEFWIKEKDGGEKPIQITGPDIPLREGQKVTMISTSGNGDNSSRYCVLVNHNANQYWFMDSNYLWEINKKYRLEPVTGKTALITVIIWILMLSYAGPNMAYVTAGMFFIYRATVKIRRLRVFERGLDKHLKDMIQSTQKLTA